MPPTTDPRAVVEAGDIKKPPSAPALYIQVLLSRDKIGKTGIRSNAAPRWEHTLCLQVLPKSQALCRCLNHALFSPAERSSILSLRLKHNRKWPARPVSLGSVDIKIEGLVDRCKNDQGEPVVRAARELPHYVIQFYFIPEGALTLIGNGQETGSLVVQLLDITTRASQAAIDDTRDNIEQALRPSPPIPKTVQDVIVSAAAVQDLGGGIMNSLKQVVDKTKIVVDFVDKVAKVCIAVGKV